MPWHLTTQTSCAAPTCSASEASTLTTPGPCTDMKGEAKHSGASNDALRSVLRSPSRMLAAGQGQQCRVHALAIVLGGLKGSAGSQA